MDTYEYKDGDFPAIVSKETWEKAQEIRQSRIKPALVSANRTTISKRSSTDIWVNKLRCSCGSSFRKNKWHIKKDGSVSYGYQCYNQLNHGQKRHRQNLGLNTDGYCDIRMIAGWKLDLMAKILFDTLWKERRKSILIALDLIKKYYQSDYELTEGINMNQLNNKLEKANTRLANIISMRADGEISKEEYQKLREGIDNEIDMINKSLENNNSSKSSDDDLKIDKIKSTINEIVDLNNSIVDHKLINNFVTSVVPIDDNTFEWYLNLSGESQVKARMNINGTKNKNTIKLEEIEYISSLHITDEERQSRIFSLLHRLKSREKLLKKKNSAL